MKTRQISKFKRLQSTQTAKSAPLDRKKVVINLSKRDLTRPEEDVLVLGLSLRETFLQATS